MTQEIVYVRRLKDGAILDIPKRDLEQTLKRGFELVEKEENETIVIKPHQIVTLETPKIVCIFCDKEYKTQKLLDKHVKTAHR